MPESKTCESCGREFEHRKKWARDWEQIKFCSDSCRRNKNKFNFKEAILELLKKHPIGKTICPSEVLPPAQKTDQEMLEHVRRSTRLLASEGLVEITQKGRPVDPLSFRGPIRLRLKK